MLSFDIRRSPRPRRKEIVFRSGAEDAPVRCFIFPAVEKRPSVTRR